MKKNGLIVDSQITASSFKYLASAVNGRLFSTSISNVSHGGWIPSDADNDPWLQVDFIVNVTVTTIYTQGSFDKPYFVKNYTIAFGYQRDIFEDYKVGGAVKVGHEKTGGWLFTEGWIVFLFPSLFFF